MAGRERRSLRGREGDDVTTSSVLLLLWQAPALAFMVAFMWRLGWRTGAGRDERR